VGLATAASQASRHQGQQLPRFLVGADHGQHHAIAGGCGHRHDDHHMRQHLGVGGVPASEHRRITSVSK